MKDRLPVAIVTKPHGIRGEIKLKSLLDDASALLELEHVFTSESAQSAVKIIKSWQYKQEVCMALEGVSSRDEADKLRGKKLFIQNEDAPPLPQDKYYLVDLIGCEVCDDTGKKLGKLTEILQHGAADVYVVCGEKNFMIPAVRKAVSNIDIKSKKITLNSETMDEVIVYED